MNEPLIKLQTQAIQVARRSCRMWKPKGIMLAEKMIKNQIRQFLAPILSITLLCLAAACVLGCEELSKELPSKQVTGSGAEHQAAKTGEVCPLNSFPKAALPQRLGDHSDQQAQVIITNTTSSDSSLTIPAVQGFAPDAWRAIDPPLQRLPSLRI